jgi:hypothetical protein
MRFAPSSPCHNRLFKAEISRPRVKDIMEKDSMALTRGFKTTNLTFCGGHHVC